MMGNILNDQEIVERWESANLGSYSWVFSSQYEMIPILEDIIAKAANIQLVFYRGRKGPDDILVKCLLNGYESTLPIPTDNFPYYRWSDLRDFYAKRCESVK